MEGRQCILGLVVEGSVVFCISPGQEARESYRYLVQGTHAEYKC